MKDHILNKTNNCLNCHQLASYHTGSQQKVLHWKQNPDNRDDDYADEVSGVEQDKLPHYLKYLCFIG